VALSANDLPTYRSFVDVLLRQTAAHGPEYLYTMLSDDGEITGRLTFADLDRRARALAARLQRLGMQGQRAILLYPPGLEYVIAFFGCLYAGVVAVPAYPPRANRNMGRLGAILEDCSPALVLTTASSAAQAGRWSEYLPRLGMTLRIETDGPGAADGPAEWSGSDASPQTLAFLQYTSGSTSEPKGVMVTHYNLLHNEQLIREAFGLGRGSIILSWLPMYHDMGLIGNIMAAIYNAAPCYLMSPSSFLRRPVVWLESITRYGITASGGPNFAYDLCIEKIRPEQRAGLDLSRWQVAFNGSEPVRAATLERFTAAFGPCGFRREAFYPCYGMAETTLFVSGGAVNESPVVRAFDRAALHANRVRLADGAAQDFMVGSGRPRLEKCVIADPAALRRTGEKEIGEIWLSDPSIGQGYWPVPELSAATFTSFLADTGEGPFLRTGDLGFILDGELYITGRLKDIIIIRGRNHYPQDIEATAENAHPVLRRGCSAAFGVTVANEERLVLVLEAAREARLRLDGAQVTETVRCAVAAAHEIDVWTVVLLPPGGILKTSSGKIRRSATREAFLRRELEPLYEFEADTRVLESPAGGIAPVHGELESWLALEVARCAKIPITRIDIHRPIAEYGFDSLAAVGLLASVEERLNTALPLEALFVGEPTIAQLATKIRIRAGGPEAGFVQPPVAFSFAVEEQ
jgi:acyl-CoA synthetase (AMP-forming)/AMP-acid ligase II/acyl carrier protein